MPSRQWNSFQSTHWCLSLWDKLRDEHLRDVVLTYAAYAAIPLIAAEVAPWLMLPLALTGVGEGVAGLAVLGAAVGPAGAGSAWLNVENGEKWYQGLGLQLIATVGELWARAGSEAGASIGSPSSRARAEGPGAMTATSPSGSPSLLLGGLTGEVKLLPRGGVNPWDGTPVSLVLQEETKLYRVYSEGASPAGRWLATAPYQRRADAMRYLALPPGNSADFISEVTIPAGTRVQIGWVRAQPAWGSDRVGGALQVYLPTFPPEEWFGPGVPLQ